MYSTKQTAKLAPQASIPSAPGSQNTVNINMNITNIGMSAGVQAPLLNTGAGQANHNMHMNNVSIPHKRSNSQVQKKHEAATEVAPENS
jgi:hypothetical protein